MNAANEVNILKMSFDQWLVWRCGMTEQELRNKLNDPKRLARCHYTTEYADAYIECYRRKYRRETDCYASRGLDYTFVEWLEVFKGHTLESLKGLWEFTGMTKKEEETAWRYLHRHYEEFRLDAENPF
jgi:hypothetical protein